MKALALVLLGSYVLLVLAAFLLADRLMFYPPVSSYSEADLPVVLVPTEDGVHVAVTHLPNPEARFTVIYCHGNAEDIGQIGFALELLREIGFSVLAFDYRGYGMSSAVQPTAAGATKDVDAVYRYARDELGLSDRELVVYGRSIGSGPAVALASRRPLAGLIVESGFVSVVRVMTRIPLLPTDPFPNLRRIERVGAPVLVIHGNRDEVIAPWHGRRLFEAAPEPKRALWVEEAGHNDLLFRASDPYVAAVRDFLELLELEHRS
jgi:abhydrolase domain-containing protein 17